MTACRSRIAIFTIAQALPLVLSLKLLLCAAGSAAAMPAPGSPASSRA